MYYVNINKASTKLCPVEGKSSITIAKLLHNLTIIIQTYTCNYVYHILLASVTCLERALCKPNAK